jgi:hypothetical protein
LTMTTPRKMLHAYKSYTQEMQNRGGAV